MRTIETALWPLERPAPDMGVGVLLGDEQAPELAGLTEGERVLLIEPNELQAEGTVHMVELASRRVWFAELDDADAIRVIYPEPTTSSHHRAKA